MAKNRGSRQPRPGPSPRGGSEAAEHNYSARMSNVNSHGSPFSRNARTGAGERAGAGELDVPANGPGAAARRYTGMSRDAYSDQVGSSATPKGMSIYDQE